MLNDGVKEELKRVRDEQAVIFTEQTWRPAGNVTVDVNVLIYSASRR